MVVSHLSKPIITHDKEMSIHMAKNYYLGFDIGTNSIGWATTDEEYNLLKARGSDFWGTYLFDEAQTAESRRMNRTSRRRYARRRQRIKLLQELFAEEIAKVDFAFVERLNNSKYFLEDKSEGVRYEDNLFHDANYTDRDFHRDYPTIYHLRRDLLDKTKARKITDIRILYLAVAHIIKNRGHFLFEGQQIKAGDKALVKESFENINKILEQMFDEAPFLCITDLSKALDIVSDKNMTKSDKERKLKDILGAKGDSTCEMLIKAMVGGKVSVKKLFPETESEVKDFCFNDDGFVIEQLASVFSDDEYALIYEAKKIYDWAVLSQILGEYKYISDAMCAKFERHKEDKRLLKEYIHTNFGKEIYDDVFSYREKLANYAAYVGRDREVNVKPCKKEDFYAFLKKYINESQCPEIMQRINDGAFLEKQRASENGVIPYQLHLAELELILENASENFPFLNDVEDGYSVKDKIVALMTFRIPYYVGPLNDAHSDGKNGFAWVKKYSGAENVKITPWNFKQVVDEQACEDAFIERMTNKCTYLIGEDVLPKQSLLYSEFAFLNELNNVTYKGNRLDKSARDAVLDYAKSHKHKINRKKIGEILENNGLIEKGEKKEENFAGIDKEIKSNFSSYIFLKGLFGDNLDVDMCEEIIRCFTIMGDSKRATERIKRQYKISDEVAKRLKDWSCSGWGRMSREFLDGDAIFTVSKTSGEMLTIIEAMRETGCNLMELLSNKYDFLDKIEGYNAQYRNDNKVTYGTVEDLYCSPAVKRAIWRSVCLAREIEKVQGCPPKRIFIEMARGEEKDKKRTKSRKEKLLDLYKSIEDDKRDGWIKEIEATEDRRFLSDKLYLYYMQMGRSAYSGKPIRIEEALDTSVCDIDHIYPQSKLKDDSVINNKVLCYKTENSAKQDIYPLPQDIRDKMLPMWTAWHNKGLISDEKFKRLTRNTALSSEELDAFIARQIVCTQQSTKEVANILKQMYPNAQVVYSKAGNVVEFKNTVNKNEHVEDIIKVREINDLHHAKDAYLNIVVGNVFYTKFNRFYKTTAQEALAKTDEEKKDGYDFRKLFYEKIDGASWNYDTMRKVCHIANKNTPRVVRFTSSGHGQLWDATIKQKGANDKLVPLKRNGILEQIDKYGGYDAAATSHFALVESLDKKGKKLISLEAIPIYVTMRGDNAVGNYLCINAGLTSPRVLIDKIKVNSLVKFNGAYYWLRGKTGNQIILCNANQLVLDTNSVAYLKKISAFEEKRKKNKNIEPSFEFDKISKEDNIKLYDILVTKLANAPYANMPTIPTQVDILLRNKNVFERLTEKEQVSVLLEIMHFVQCNSTLSNLTTIGGDKTAGNLRKSKKINANEEALLITQSPTGYYRETVDLTAYYRQ